jgi:hypothetical protein
MNENLSMGDGKGLNRRSPISVYLTPRAAMILRDYNEGSGYGSLSRTVEEIILAFDSVYKIVKQNYGLPKNANKPLTDEEKIMFFMVLMSSLQNIQNSVSRLTSSSEISQGGNS